MEDEKQPQTNEAPAPAGRDRDPTQSITFRLTERILHLLQQAADEMGARDHECRSALRAAENLLGEAVDFGGTHTVPSNVRIL